jgi:hypothetical protein
MKKWFSVLILFCMLALSFQVQAKMIELEVYRDWRGNECNFKSSRPFFLIKDLYDLERFWSQANADEDMPYLDFKKYMLLVWSPGPSLFDHQPVKVERFTYKNGRFFVLMNLQRKDTGGYWRKPFVATLLPRTKSGDLFIMRKEVKGANRITWKHVFTIWDMSPDRNMPFEVVQKLDEKDEKRQYIDPKRHPEDEETSLALLPKPSTSRATRSPKQTVSQSAFTQTPASKNTSSKITEEGDEFDDDLFSSFGSSSPKTNESQPESESSKKSQKKSSTKKQRSVTPPAFEEDPLFGEEFDINF